MSEFDADLDALRRRSQPTPAPAPVLDNAELDLDQDLAQIRNAKANKPEPADAVTSPDTVNPRPLTKDELAVDELNNSLRHAANSDPVNEAQRRNLANRLGVDKAMLPEGEEAQQELFLKENTPEALLRSNPEVAAYLNDLDNAAVAGKDVSNLKAVSDLMRRLTFDPMVATAKTTVAVPQTLAGVYKIYDRAVMSMIPDSLIKAVDNATPQAAREALGSIQDSLGGLVDFEQTQNVIEKLYSPETLAAKARVAEAKGFLPTITTALENPSSIATTVGESIGPMLLGGAGAQLLVKAFPALAPLVAGAAGEGITIAGGTAQGITEETGQPLTGQQAAVAAGAGALGAGIGVLGGKIMQKLGLADIDTALAKGGLEAALKESKVPNNLATRILAGAVGEGALEELPQSAIEQVAHNVGVGKPWDEGVEEAMAMGLLAGAATGGVVQAFTPKAPQEGLNKEIDDATVEALRNVGKAQQAQDTRQTLDEFSKGAAKSELRRNSPEEFKKFVRTMSDEGGMIEEVYVDANLLEGALAQSEITPEELQEKMPDVAKAINLAKETSSDVRISFDDYATYIAGSKAETPILEHLRTSPEGMTYAESQQFFQGQEKELTAQAKKIMEENQPVLSRKEFEAQEGGDYQAYLKNHENKKEAFAEDARQVHDKILQGLANTNRFTKGVNAVYAVPFREFFATAAAKERVMPSEMFERMPLNFKNVKIEDGLLTQTGATTATPEDFTKENVKDILTKTDWMVVTARNPGNTVVDEEVNAANNEALKKDLKSRGLDFEAVMGRYGNDEIESESFIVYGVDLVMAAEFTRKYNQESVLTREGFVYQNGTVAPTSQVDVYDDTTTALQAGGYTRVPSTGAIFSTDFQNESFNVRGVHFSKEQREFLRGDKAGTGIPAAERGRLFDSEDPRITQRIDFYTDTGNGVTPEAGLGGVRHEILLKNIYNGTENPRKFKALPGRMPFQKMNDFETQVLDAGFDGYFVEQGGQGRVVLLGAAAENVATAEDEVALKYGITGAPTTGPVTSTREADGSLRGLPRSVGAFNASVFPAAEEVAANYMKEAGLEYNPPNVYAKVDKERAKRIADAFEAMEHNPQDPDTKAAYRTLIEETVAQYEAIVKQTGLKVEFVTGEDPYAGNPRAMTEDVRSNNHMWVFSTRDGFGTDQNFDPADNPLLAETNITISGQKALANDIFRMVHDYFGHVKEGVGFRADGEENAWRAHASMFSPLALRALTTETRGQNSWLNYGPFGATNRKAKVEDTHFADQKIGLLPEWVSEEGRGDPIDSFAQSVKLIKGTETLKKYGLKPGQPHSTREVAAALEARQRAKYGTISRTDRSKDAIKRISSWMADEVVHEMQNPENSGAGWYSEKFQNALDTLGDLYPELKEDKSARDTMTVLIAVTSDGANVAENILTANDIYATYRKTGKFTSGRGSQRAVSVKGNLKVLQELYDSMGKEKAHEYLMAEMTISDLKKEAAKRGNKVTTSYQAHIKVPMAALELGPKLGAFYANLMGSHGYLTMDRWWSRTFNRYRGTLLDSPTSSSLNSFKELIGKPEMSDDGVLSESIAPQAAYEGRGFKTKLAELVGRSQMGTSAQQASWLKEAKEKAGTSFDELMQEHKVERAANTIYKAAFIATMDAPFNSSDRTFMLDATAEARRKLSRRGYSMSTADIQAVLWYYEKKLYGELGAQQTAKISYEEAAQRLVAGGLSEATGGDPDGKLSALAEGLSERVSPGESEFVQPLQNQGPLFQFAGQVAATANLHDLDRAKQLAETGMDNEDIRQITGWFKGIDGKWRFEIDDQEAKIHDKFLRRGDTWGDIFDKTVDAREDTLLGDVIDHPRLFSAYPQLEEMHIGVLPQDRGASYIPGEGSRPASLKIGSKVSTKNLLSFIMHEVQHGLQNIEGFARGGSPEFVNKLKTDNIDKITRITAQPEVLEVLQKLDDLTAEMEGSSRKEVDAAVKVLEAELAKDSPAYQEYLSVLEEMDFLRLEEDPMDGYQRLAGEIEARNTQTRLTMGAAAREIFSPETTQDVGSADAIVVFRDGVQKNLPPPDNAGLQVVEHLPATIEVDGKERSTTNSDGKPLAQTVEGVTNFWRWFGDSEVATQRTSSRDTSVLKPITVYHGTKGSFTEFDVGRETTNSGTFGSWQVSRQGVFFSKAPVFSEGFARMGGEEKANIMPTYLSIKNAIHLDEETIDQEDMGALLEQGVNHHRLNTPASERWELFDDKEVVDAMKAAGFDGAVIMESDPDTEEEYEVWVAFEANQIKSAVGNDGGFDPANPDILHQQQDQIRAAYDPTNFTISLLKGADLSSVIHEGGHFYLEALADMASQPNAPQQVKDDFRKTLSWFGIEGDNPEMVWRMMTLDQKRQSHEQWAQSFERYALEGKAPTTEMQPVFSRFRAWMLSVYKSLKQFLEQNPLAGKLNDDIRSVFDRLLASEEAIRESEKQRDYAPLFSSAGEAGTTPEKFQEYLEQGDAATSQALDELSSRSLRDMQWLSNAKDKAIRKLQAQQKVKRAEIRKEVAERVDAEPVNQARRLLKKGELLNADGTLRKLKEHKLNTAEVKSLRPDMKLVKLSGMTKPDGLSPDLAAQFFGFSSGDALIESLLTEPSAKQKTDDLTDKRMLEENGELVDQDAIQRAAEKAIHNEARARFMATGLSLLMKNPSGSAQMARAAKAAAEAAIEEKKVRELSPAQYARAEQRANKEAVKQAAKDTQKAITAQRAALLNNRLSRAASDAKLEVEAALRYLKKFDSPGVRKKLDIDYIEQIDDLRAAFDLRKGVTKKALDKRKSLSDWIDEQEANGFEPAIDPAVMDDLKRKHYKDMTLTEIRGLVDSIKQVEHLGRMKKKLLTLKGKREFEAVVDDAFASIELHANRIVPERATPTDVVGVTAKWLRSMTAAHRKFNSIIREMDGGRDNGTMWNLLSRGMNEAGDIETEMKQTAATKIAELFKTLPKHGSVAGNIYSKKRQVPNTSLSMTYEQRIMFAMNWGNEGNRQRLMDGGISGARALSSVEAKAVLDTLDKADWDFVQGVWDYIAGYKDQVAALERKITGVEPQWIEAAPVQTRFGTYRGGYFPAKYDTELSTRSESLEASTDLRMGMKGAFQSAAARNGYTKARADQVINRPLLLSYNVISQHVSEVTHRLAWQPWLIDANRLLKAVDAPVRKHYGVEILKELRDTVVDIAQGDAPAKNATEAAINRLRVGSTVVGMGWRVSTALLQPTGLSQSWSRIGGRWMARGIAQYGKNPNAAGRLVNEKSRLMKDRGITMQREINEVLNTIRAGEKVSALKASFFTMIGKMQRTVDIPTWLGAYEKGLEQLKYQRAVTEQERKSIEEHAVALADQAVIDSQSGGQLKDLAKVQRGSPLFKIFTNFYSYFSAAYNLNVEAVRRTDFRSPSQVGLLAVDMLLINVVPVIMAVALKLALKGGCDADDIECLADTYAQEQVGHFMGQMILLREAGAAVAVASGGAGYGYQGPAGLRFFGDLYKAGTQVNQGEADMALFKSVNSVAGALLHYPAGQINSTVEGIMAVERGDVEGVSILPALISGPPK